MLKCFVPASLVCAALVLQTPAATVRVWSGANLLSGNWSSSLNWDGGVAPVPGDTLVFPDTGLRRTSNTNNFANGTTFSAITFGGTGYILRGNTVTISNSVNAALTSGTNTVDLNIEAGQFALTVQALGVTESLTISGDIDLNARTLVTSGPGDIRITGVISGTGGVYKNNTGDLRMDGLGANTYSGNTTVNAGILRLGRYVLRGFVLVGTVAIPGDLVIGSGTSGPIGDVVALERDSQIANTSDVFIYGSGSLELSGQNDTIGSMRLTAGSVLTAGGLLTLNGHVFVAYTPQDSLIAGNLDLGTNTTCRFDIANGAQLNISAQISGDAITTLIKTNLGVLFLSGSNIFDSPVLINGGSVIVAHGSALGSLANNTRLESGAVVIHDVGVFGEELDVQGPSATLQMDATSAAWNGSVILNDDLTIYSPTNRTIAITGQISGPRGFTKTGDGGLLLKSTYTNTFAGVSWLANGSITLDGVSHQTVISAPMRIGQPSGVPGTDRMQYIKNHQVGDTVPLIINESGAVQLGGDSDVVGTVSGAGNLELGAGTFAVGGDNGSATFSGEISGAGGTLEKIGTGTWTLSGTSSWSGITLVSTGGMVINGLQAANPVRVGSVTFLRGIGTLGRLTNAPGGLVNPGTNNNPGVLTCGHLMLSAGSTYHVKLNGASPGSGHDQLNVQGSINLSGALLTGTCGFTPSLAQAFIIINNDGADAVTGTFQGLPQGSVFALGGFAFRINYQGGTGNDVAIIRVQSPASALSQSSMLPNGNFQFQGTGLPGLAYVVQAASNLNPVIQWTPIGTNTVGPSGLYQFIDTDAPLYAMRFYRAVGP